MNQRTSINFYSNRRKVAIVLGGCVISLGLALYAVKEFYAHDVLMHEGYAPALGTVLPLRNISVFWFSAISALLLALAIAACVYRLFSSKPRAIMNAEGIWRPGYGLIAWDKIKSIETVTVAEQPIIGIVLKDQAIDCWSRPRRFRMMINKRLSGAHISLDGHLTTPQDEILAIARDFQQLSQKMDVDNCVQDQCIADQELYKEPDISLEENNEI